MAGAKSLGGLEVSDMIDSIDVFASDAALVNFLGVCVWFVELEMIWRDCLSLGVAVEVVICCVYVVLHLIFGHLGDWFMHDVLLVGYRLHVRWC